MKPANQTLRATIAPSVPRAAEPERFRAEPLGYLRRMRAELGDLFVLRERGPILSRTPECRGVVAVFGAERQRAVLADIESFGMPPSAATQLALPATLATLNRSLHSMRGDEHARQKRLLMSMLDELAAGDVSPAWRPGSTIALLTSMRELTLRIASRTMFGQDDAPLAATLSRYFHLRRRAAADDSVHDALVAAGEEADAALRAAIRTAPRGLLRVLAQSELAEDEAVGHANILFVSATEPIAIALTWTLLILSQVPELRRALRDDPSLVDMVISESLRVLPPNALMVRITTRPLSLCGTELPGQCEIILSPFVAHRDASVFPDPDVFRPARWRDARPSPFDYFPFGAGGHACVGRALALEVMKRVLVDVTTRYDVVLDGDQEIDWRIDIQFLPDREPRVVAAAPDASRAGGVLRGGAGALLTLQP